MDDHRLLAEAPDFISVSGFLKAMPQTEGMARFVYFEASNEGLDQQNEIISAKALAESADYYKRYGNVDIDHFTLVGRPNPARGIPGIPDYMSYEIGVPIEVRQSGKITFVKAQIKSGDGPAAERANQFWDSLQTNPPTRWYPSVGGSIDQAGRQVQLDPKTGEKRVLITKVRWTNIGVSLTPVNQHVPGCATVPVGAFAKCSTAAGFDLTKALTAGYGADSASLTGGSALRIQSLDRGPATYMDWRDRTAGAIRDGKIRSPNAEGLIEFSARTFGMQLSDAAEYVERFLRDLKTGLRRRNS
ncbi:MAG: hypothetical protein AB9M53_01080 [Leptothrix sp. (in: b-proteobacteria)]